ncbi:hypothetical protein [Pedobacter gandavensis]|uniref:Uncharacterized protein n=1 Tax=Pedobacter gandavensis TaxID=2679963 RepID=A0ABR6EXK1_9SPHI|nr:hypothetical protein [Pedobacter gandavensis]MBB2149158.1 hypothetical protein [Pedobacter gandavensis]
MITKSLIQIMLNDGYYSTMNIDPMKHHGYNETIELLTEVLEEIEVECLLRPQDIDKLLDHRNSISKRLYTLEADKRNSMPSVH